MTTSVHAGGEPELRAEDFDFDLPERLIALRPAEPRDSARLLAVQGADLTDWRVNDLPRLLRAGDLLVVNDTRVIPAALTGWRPARAKGGNAEPIKVEVNLHQPISDGVWHAFARPAKRLRAGDQLSFAAGLQAQVRAVEEGQITLVFNCMGKALDQALEQAGRMPLPPYIEAKRAVDARDQRDYQTVFAEHAGSVAAPTAGLHFTPALLEALAQAGVGLASVTLHVGAGTFLPVKTDTLREHRMHAEWRTIPEPTVAAIAATKALGGRVIAVGTTSLRALESAAQPDGVLRAVSGSTDIFITPGYRFNVINGLMTNFHLPRSTLFMLVSALMGRDVMLKAYLHAIASDYRFYSYGDASLLLPAPIAD